SKTYDTWVVENGILIGAMNRLLASSTDFKFTYSEHPDFGPFLETVNGLAGKQEEHTYWQLLSQTSGDEPKPLVVGIGCYQPKKDERIILKFTSWDQNEEGQCVSSQ
uniref:Uncharacterized protein n=1 Tax=Echeneis naucrates TaxID=173247 RepID=A0A665VU89_ECHNA